MRTVDPVSYAARRRQILEAAARVFAANGYDAATTAAICREAGIGSGTLFHYFPDKRSIFTGLFEDDFGTLQRVLSDLPSDPVDALFAVVDALTDEADDPTAPGLVLAALNLASRDAAFAETLVAHDRAVHDALARLLQRAADAGEVRAAIDPARAARWITTMSDGLYLMAGDANVDIDAERVELRTLIARYLGLDRPGSS